MFLVLSLGLSAQTPHGTSLAIACADCHNSTGWEFMGEGANFTHDDVGFELKFSHLDTDCKKCHSTLIFNEADPSCISCHTDMHSMSVGNDCVRCHDERNWLVDNIPELHEMNGFPLLGEHRLISCSECHKSESNLRWDWMGSDCVTCHIDNYHATTSPNHIQSGFSQECTECHSPGAQSWEGAENFHLFFPLVGRHNISDCASCHLSENYSDTSPDCVSCHENDYLATTSPDHVSSNFGTDCAQCHFGDTWQEAIFASHDMFPLVGKHNISDCAECHDVNNYSNISPECVSCHEDDYLAVNSPNHVSSGFSQDCTLCHTGDTWGEASYDQHDSQYFPIFSGKHQGEWTSCNECHIGGDYSTFSCIVCHNDQQNLAGEHNEENNYVYESNACYACHPTGDED
ncbi:MAG: hypothetical protein COA49_05855 [Bacteroidetes bacterium]|nr:MAG: hypothetical protein COA49_05855 [Bacteroidota bacterium]